MLLSAIGLLVGTLGTLIGAGGGFILVPVLMFLRPDLSAERITAVSLAVVFCNALSGTITYALKRKVDFRRGLLFAVIAIPGALVGAHVSSLLSRAVFDPIFAVALFLIAVMIWIRPSSARTEEEPIRNVGIGAVASVFVGFLSSVLGIGGGIIHMPMLVMVMRYTLTAAVATSHFILCITSFAGTLMHIHENALDFGLAAQFAPGVVIGAQLGAWLSRRIPAKAIARAASVALLAVAVRIALR